MSIDLATKYASNTDELFKAESKTSLLTNTDYDWTGVRSVKVYKISTCELTDYDRNGTSDNLSRYGALSDLSATTQEMLLKNDRSFIFNVDTLDTDETAGQLEAGTALARELREVVVPEVDKYVYSVMAENAGTKADPISLTAANIYDAIIAGDEVMDDAEVPDTERVLVVTPKVYRTMKQCQEINLNSDISEEMRLRGVITMVDGLPVVKVPASRLPDGFGFIIAHPSATVAPVKLEDFSVHDDTPLSSGSIVTGRICYDCFVLDNKKKGIYYQPVTAEA